MSRILNSILILIFWVHLPVTGQEMFLNPVILNEEAGLTDNYVTSIIKDEAGFMWFGTLRGLCRYDGSRLRSYRHIEGDTASLAHNYVLDLALGSEGYLWVSTANGLCRYDPQTDDFRAYGADAGDWGFLPNARVNCFFEDRQGQKWAGLTGGSLVLFDDANRQYEQFFFKASTTDPDVDVSRIKTVIDVVQDLRQDSILWVATLAGLVRFNKADRSYRWYYDKRDNRDHQYRFNAMKAVLPLQDGRLAVGSWGGAGIFDPKTEKFTSIALDPAREERQINYRMVRSLLAPEPGKLWVSYSSGLLIYDTEENRIIRAFFNDEEQQRVYGATFIDEAHRIWTRSELGVFLYNPLFQKFTTRKFPKSSNRDHQLIPRAVLESSRTGELIFCVDSGEGLYLFDRSSGQFDIVRPPGRSSDRNNFSGQDMIRLKDGRILVLTQDRIFEYREKEKRLIPTSFVFEEASPFFRRFVQADNGELWIGSRRGGMFRIDLATGAVQIYREELETNGSSNRFIWLEELHKDHYGNIWFRASSGYSVYDYGRDTLINLPFISGNNVPSFLYIRNFDEGPDGKIWLISDDPGLGWADSRHPELGIMGKIQLPESLQADNIENLKWDNRGKLWINHERGLTRFDPESGRFNYFDRGYGKPLSLGNLMTILPSQEIIIDAPKGFTIFHPVELSLNREVPKPYLVSVKALDREVIYDTAQSRIRLPYWQNFLSFEFSAINYNLPENQQFAYQLKGLDEDWNFTGERNYASYTHLDGGDYVFRLKTANSEGEWSNEVVELFIRIETPWWKTWWFWTVLVAAVLGLTVLIVRWRIAQIRHKEKLRSDFERKLGDVEMHALRAQMNPHFIFNSLNSIDYYIIKNQTEKASSYLNRFSRLIRLILQNSRANYISLRDELEALRLYIEMESMRFDQQFEYEICIQKGLPVDELEIPPMLLQPYVENAIWHGLMQKEGRGKLKIALARNNGKLNCLIEDNGIGRQAAEGLRSKSAGQRRSMGMQITNDRIGMINKLYNKQAEVTVTDLYDALGRAAGTRVEVDIPL